MPALTLLALAALMHAPVDTGQMSPDEVTAGPVHSALVAGVRASDDALPRRRRSIEVSEWYERRLRIHRYGAYTIIPLFALQAYAGNELYNDGSAAASRVKPTHRFGATALATVFTINTVTGVWNLWDSRAVPQGRTKRYL